MFTLIHWWPAFSHRSDNNKPQWAAAPLLNKAVLPVYCTGIIQTWLCSHTTTLLISSRVDSPFFWAHYTPLLP